MNDRILKFLQSEGINAKQFALEIGVLNSSVSHVLSGRNKPSFDFIQKMLTRYSHLNPEWLILGKGPMIKSFHSSPEIPQSDESGKISPEKNSLSNLRAKDLFSSVESTPLQQIEQKTDPNLKRPTGLPDKSVENSSSFHKSIERIVIFYSDQSFAEYRPELKN